MSVDSSPVRDAMSAAAGYQRDGGADHAALSGHGVAEVHGPDGELKQRIDFQNLITQVGLQVYGERGSGAASPAAPTGMALGTGSTAAALTGAGAALVAGVTASAVALTGTPSSAVSGSQRRLTYTCTWAAGVATANGITEVVLQNGTATTVPTNASTTNIISRSVLGTTVNKGAADSLTITWQHDLG